MTGLGPVPPAPGTAGIVAPRYNIRRTAVRRYQDEDGAVQRCDDQGVSVRVPFVTGGDGAASGLDPVQVFNLTILPRKWGRLLVGVLGQFAPDRPTQDIGDLGIGPIVGAIVTRAGWTR
jgi:hypothetical protein